jgi:PhnB protein
MNVDIYINYRGCCEEAFTFYAQLFGGRVTMMQRHQAGGQGNLPAEWAGKVLHARVEIGTVVIMGADIPNAEPMRSAYVSVRVDSDPEAERLYDALRDGGEVFMEMKEMFYASRFAMLRDRFGTSWKLMHEKA